MKQFWCIPCKGWHERRVCPDCGIESGSGYNGRLAKAALDNHLFAQAESAEKERRQYAAIQAGYEIPPTREQRKLAKQIVADL